MGSVDLNICIGKPISTPEKKIEGTNIVNLLVDLIGLPYPMKITPDHGTWPFNLSERSGSLVTRWQILTS